MERGSSDSRSTDDVLSIASSSPSSVRTGDPPERGGGARVGSLILQAAQMAEMETVNRGVGSGKAAQFAAAKRQQSKSSRRMESPESAQSSLPQADMEGDLYRAAPSIYASGVNIPEDEDFGEAKAAARMGGQKYHRLQGKSFNMQQPPAFTLLDMGRQNRKSKMSTYFSLTQRQQGILSAAFLTIAIVAVLTAALLIMFLYVPIKDVVIVNVGDMEVKYWSTWDDKTGEIPNSLAVEGTSASVVYLWATMYLEANISNPSMVSSANYNITMDVLYDRTVLGSAQPAIAGQLERGNSTAVMLKWKCERCRVNDVGQALMHDERDGHLPVIARIRVFSQRALGYVVMSPWVEKAIDFERVVTPQN